MTIRQHKYLLDESQMPTSWYNIIPDLPAPPPPPLHPGTHEPVGPDDLAPLFPMDLILQEVSSDRYIPIPDEVQDIYRLWRPSPLYRAHRLEKALGTPAHIYYKYEGVSPSGSHKSNTAVPQVYYNAKAGIRKLTTETGAGQWGTALAFACALFDVDCEVLLQLAMAGESGADLVIGCTGGGSNFGGLAFPFIREKLAGRQSPIIRAVEPASCPSLTRGEYRYDFGDTAGFTPLMKMHTLGHDFVPDPIHAGGLRYHGMAPLISHVYELGLMEAIAVEQTECFAAAITFARTEGIVPAPEPTHALAATMAEALACKASGEEKVIVTALCGHGLLDLAAYEAYLSGSMIDSGLSDEDLASALAAVPVMAG